MKLIKVGAAVLNQTPRDWKGNLANIKRAIREAKEQGVTILCLPEATITGYGLEDDLFCADVARRAMYKLGEIAGLTKDMIVCVGLPVQFNNTLYNTVATLIDGKVAGFTCKQHLAGDGIHYEPRHYKPWPAGVVQTLNVPELGGSGQFPIGDVHFNVGGVKIGYEICEDAWVANRPGTILATKGVDVYLNPSASHFSFGKLTTRKNFVIDGSRAFNATYIYTNLVGNEAGRAIYDGGAMIASGGNLLAVGKRFTFENVLLTTAVVDIDSTRTAQVRTSSFMPNVEEFNKGCVNVFFKYPEISEKNVPLSKNSWETSEYVKHEECTRAIGLALMDYMRKSHTKGFAISLSGGADSALVTYLCEVGIRLGVAELGIQPFILKYCPHLSGAREDMLIRELITTAYQATAQSGSVTRTAAEDLAKILGVTHFNFDVDPMVRAYAELGNIIQGMPMTFAKNDVPLQNLQARVRAPGIWLIANMQNKLLLTTSNMSEAAVGYATMDGDTAGCVAPIAGLSKVYVREYLKWAEIFGPQRIGQLAVLGLINSQQPTAELRPATANQTDEADLMPYWLLHEIELLVVKNRYVPVEVYKYLRTAFPDYAANGDVLKANIKKFFRLFSMNQWKRERYALSFHMDDHNLDPRTWCRTPILTGGYEEELEELDKLKY
jgi:NAD+ synthase (glutamine-hydrolysing)